MSIATNRNCKATGHCHPKKWQFQIPIGTLNYSTIPFPIGRAVLCANGRLMRIKEAIQVVSVEHACGLVDGELGHGVSVLDEDVVNAVLGADAGELADANLLVDDVLPGLQVPRVHPVPERAPCRHPRPPPRIPLLVAVGLGFPTDAAAAAVPAELAEAEALLVPDHAEVGLGLGRVDGGSGRDRRRGGGVAAADDGAEAVVELGDVVGCNGGRRGGGRGGRR